MSYRMPRDEAHALLDAVNAGLAAATEEEMRRALIATGDLADVRRIPAVVPVEKPMEEVCA